MEYENFTWRRVYFLALSRMDYAPGCYAVYADGQLVYIGQSVNLHLRFRRYGFRREGAMIRTPWGSFSSVSVKVCYSRKYGDWAMRELRLIRRLKPKFNVIQYAGIESKRA